LTEPAAPSGLGLRLGVLRDLYRMLSRSGRWWLMPMMAVLVLLGLALVGLQAIQYVAPFIYAVF
jgi:hypothetical protein